MGPRGSSRLDSHACVTNFDAGDLHRSVVPGRPVRRDRCGADAIRHRRLAYSRGADSRSSGALRQ